MKIVLFAGIIFLSCTIRQDTGVCEIVTPDLREDYSDTISGKFGTLELNGGAMHDTTAPDFFSKIRDMETGYPIPGVKVTLKDSLLTTDSNGEIGFPSFHNTDGIFTIRITHPAYRCLEIKELPIMSGQIIHAGIALRRKE
jgi:hypothetical protein